MLTLSACKTTPKPITTEVLTLSGEQEVVTNAEYYALVEIQIEGTLSKDGQVVDAYYLLGETISQVPKKSILEINGYTALPPNGGSFPPDYEENHAYFFYIGAGYELATIHFRLKPEYVHYTGQLQITLKDISEGNPR